MEPGCSVIMASTLLINLVSANLTRDTELFGNMDPYCKVYLGPQVKISKVLNSAGKLPIWNQVLAFSRTLEDSIRIEVWDKDLLKSDDLIGTAVCSLEVVGLGQKMTQELPLLYQNNPAGTIRVEITIGSMGQMGTNSQPPGFFVGPPAYMNYSYPFQGPPPAGFVPQYGEYPPQATGQPVALAPGYPQA